MVNHLSNKEKMMQDYIKELVKASYPNVDVRDNGAFMEMFGMPHIKMMLPLIDYADRIKLMQSIDNAELMSEEEMDEVSARKNVYRNLGEKAKGYIAFYFNDIPKSGVVTIPERTEIRSKQGLTYVTTVTRVFTEDQLVDMYDSETFRYKIVVEAEAEATGTDYNVEEGDITSSGTDLPFLDEVRNETRFLGGKNKETNAELAQRVKESIAAPNLGNTRGYEKYIRSFDNVEDVRVVGYGHPLMKRDIIGQYKPDGPFIQTVRDVHWGQKVDLYVRGKDLEEFEENLEVKFNAKRNHFEAVLTEKPVSDIISVKLYDPFGSNDDPDVNQSKLFIQEFHLEKDENFETMGTLKEKAYVVMEHEDLQNGSLVTVRYRKNSLIERIDSHMNQYEERPPATDVKIKEANKKFLHFGMVVKLKTGAGVRDKDKNLMFRQGYDAVKQLRMGEEMQYSDVLSPFVDTFNIGVDDTEQIIDYIHLPPQFLLLENDNRFLYHSLDEKRRSVIQFVCSLSQPLREIVDRYKDKVTVNDYFDIMHTFTYGHNIEDILTLLKKDAEDITDESVPVDYVRKARRLINNGLIPEMLSPAITYIQENEYFELANMNVYEYKQYSMDEMKEMFWTAQNIVNGPRERDEEGNVITNIDLDFKGGRWLDYTIFVAAITYVATLKTEDVLIGFLIEFLRKFTDNNKEIDLKL
jgi:hypothetical protein